MASRFDKKEEVQSSEDICVDALGGRLTSPVDLRVNILCEVIMLCQHSIYTYTHALYIVCFGVPSNIYSTNQKQWIFTIVPTHKDKTSYCTQVNASRIHTTLHFIMIF